MMDGCLVFSLTSLTVGIMRCAAYSAASNRALHVPSDDPALHDSAIQHFHDKLLNIRERLKTNVGKQMGEKRHAFVSGGMNEVVHCAHHPDWFGQHRCSSSLKLSMMSTLTDGMPCFQLLVVRETEWLLSPLWALRECWRYKLKKKRWMQIMIIQEYKKETLVEPSKVEPIVHMFLQRHDFDHPCF